MSIYSGLEDTIRLLRVQVAALKDDKTGGINAINHLIEQIQRHCAEKDTMSARLGELHAMNEELDDHVHQLQASLAMREEIIATQDDKLEAIRLIA